MSHDEKMLQHVGHPCSGQGLPRQLKHARSAISVWSVIEERAHCQNKEGMCKQLIQAKII